MDHFRSIWGLLRLNFSILDLHFFDFSKSVRNRPENIPKPSQNHPQTIPNPFKYFRYFRFFLVRKSVENYRKNGLMTGQLRPFRAIGSIGNEFAASISSSLSLPRPPRAFPRAIFGKSDFQLDHKIAYKPIFEPITDVCHHSSWIRLVFLCRFMMAIRFFAL